MEDVEAVHWHCPVQGFEVTLPPRWGVCERHIRYPAGFVFRISQGLEWRNRPASANLPFVPFNAGHVLAAPFAKWPQGFGVRNTELGQGILDTRRDLS